MKKKKVQSLNKALMSFFRFISLTYKTTPAFKIVGWEMSDKNIDTDELTIQVIGKRTCIKLKPLEIFYDDNLLPKFSAADIKTICILAMSAFNQPKYKIIVNDFRNNLNQEILTIRDAERAKLIKKSVHELSSNMIKDFGPIDAYNIGLSKGRHNVRNKK